MFTPYISIWLQNSNETKKNFKFLQTFNILSSFFRAQGDKGIPSDKILEAYEEILRKAYLATGNCTEEDVIKFKGFMATKLEGELSVIQ